ncbi:MAG: hypothetical protein CVU39_09165 [Chloroflexi bacterium HGW-Chloroflexi-10]|nr:MAG: hypothetical protein CVU39_09165 [Chloroflexi bacterium HGW-Chloroflexi-10]
MRILVLTHEYPPIGGGGGKVAQDLSRGFVKAGNEVLVLTAQYAGLASLEDDAGVRVQRINSWRSKPFQAGIKALGGYLLLGTVVSMRLIRSWKPDVIHVNFAVPAGPIGWILSRLYGIPYVITAHLGDVPGGVPEKTDRWFRWIFPFTPLIWKKAAAVIAVSEYTRQLVLKHYPVTVNVIPNGVNLGKMQAENLRIGDPPRIVFAGRFMEQKNPLGLIAILATIKHLPWRFVMIGDGPLKPAVEAAIQEAGLAERCQLTGWVSPEEVRQYFLESDLLLMPSLSEGLPVVGVQALSAGLALVVSRIGGFLDLVDEGQNGYLLPANRMESWTEVLSELLAHPEELLAMRRSSLAMAQRFDLDTIVTQYLAVFEKFARR